MTLPLRRLDKTLQHRGSWFFAYIRNRTSPWLVNTGPRGPVWQKSAAAILERQQPLRSSQPDTLGFGQSHQQSPHYLQQSYLPTIYTILLFYRVPYCPGSLSYISPITPPQSATSMLARREIAAEEVAEHEMAAEEAKAPVVIKTDQMKGNAMAQGDNGRASSSQGNRNDTPAGGASSGRNLAQGDTLSPQLRLSPVAMDR